MIVGRLVRRRITLTGMAALLLAIAPMLAGSGVAHPIAAPPRPTEGCMDSTHSVRQLAMIDHTSEGGFQCLGVYVQGDTVKAIRLERHTPDAVRNAVQSGSALPVDRQRARDKVTVVEFPPTMIDSPQGAVIDGVPGHDAIVLHGHLSAQPGGGSLVLSYLYNGFTGEYHSCAIALDRTAGSGWQLVNRLDQPFSLINVRIRQLPVIGIVGIANLEGACA